MNKWAEWLDEHQVEIIRLMLWGWVFSILPSLALGLEHSIPLLYVLSLWAIIRTEATNLKQAIEKRRAKGAAREVVEAMVKDPRIPTES